VLAVLQRTRRSDCSQVVTQPASERADLARG
jgi:hypothetical protein